MTRYHHGDADGTFSYDPNGGFEALNLGDTTTETVRFKLSDGSDTVSRTVAITINGQDDNTAPVARDVLYVVKEDDAPGSYRFDADDPDPDDDPGTLTYASPGMVVPPFGIAIPNPTAFFVNNLDGTFSLIGGEDLRAMPVGDTREYAFTYQVTDSHGLVSSPATLTFRVEGENDAPTRPPFGFGLFAVENTGPVTQPYQVIDPDSDDNSATLTYVIDQPSGITIVDNGNGTFTVDTDVGFDHLAPSQSQTVVFDFTATDRHGATTHFTNSGLTVVGVNDDPVAAADELATGEDTVLDGSLFVDNGKGPDSDGDDGDTFQVTAINGAPIADGAVTTLPSGALLTVGADGAFSYDPSGRFEWLASSGKAHDTFTYEIEDSFGGTDTATVSIAIVEVGDPYKEIRPIGLLEARYAEIDVTKPDVDAADIIVVA